MAKSRERIEARKLRSQGLSIGEIRKKVKASRSTISLWVRDIKLTQAQINRLLERSHSQGEPGRLEWARIQKERRIAEEERLRKEGLKEVGELTDREFFIAGAALYWAEGYKASNHFGIVNSDPKMVLFMTEWLKKTLQLDDSDFIPWVGINIAHKDRAEDVKRYWSTLTGIPLKQFRKTSFKYYKLKKDYENFNNHWGTLSLSVRRGTSKVRRARGWIAGLADNGLPGRIKREAA